MNLETVSTVLRRRYNSSGSYSDTVVGDEDCDMEVEDSNGDPEVDCKLEETESSESEDELKVEETETSISTSSAEEFEVPEIKAENKPKQLYKVPCPHCEVCLKNKKMLKNHLHFVHTIPQYTFCPQCLLRMKFGRRFMRHLHFKHGILQACVGIRNVEKVI